MRKETHEIFPKLKEEDSDLNHQTSGTVERAGTPAEGDTG